MDISVIVPTYNRADLIAETLDSILGQTVAPAEVIVVDDGSTDNTEQVVAGFGNKVKYLRISNSGECAARNAGVAISTAPWISFCDSDDLWRPNKLELQARLVEFAPQVQYSFTNFSTVVNGVWDTETKHDTSPENYWDLPGRRFDSNLLVVEKEMFGNLLRHQPIFPSTLMMKKSFFESVGRWSEPLGRTRSVDLEFHLRCVMHPPIGVVLEPVVGIRKHASNFSGDPLINALGEIEILRYVLAHHEAAKVYDRELRGEIASRCVSAAETAFSNGNLTQVRALLGGVPESDLSRKQRWKKTIAGLPAPLAEIGRRLSIGLAAMGKPQ